MSQKNGTRAEKENADRLIAQGHTVMFFSTTSPADLLDVCCKTLVEVKTTSFKIKKFSGRERDQLRRLLEMRESMPIRYDVKFIRLNGNHSVWESFHPVKVVSSLTPTSECTQTKMKIEKTALKSTMNKNKIAVKPVGGAKK